MSRLVLLCLIVAGCRAAEVSPPARSTGLSLDEARGVVARFEALQATGSAGDPLLTPASLDDVLTILKRDQLDLFPAGAAFAAAQPGATAAALRAQIELAWAEAQLILADVFADVSGSLRASVRGLRIRVVSGEGTEKDAQRLGALEQWIDESDLLSEALTRLAAEHAGEGARLARTIIAEHPTDYLGYRVAADYHRLRGDWPAFEAMVRKLEETNPDSNGLLFLRGTAALWRDGDASRARSFFRHALERDPAFTRAQAQLVVGRGDAREAFAEYQKLRALNPRHQIVVWAGEALTAAFEAERR